MATYKGVKAKEKELTKINKEIEMLDSISEKLEKELKRLKENEQHDN